MKTPFVALTAALLVACANKSTDAAPLAGEALAAGGEHAGEEAEHAGEEAEHAGEEAEHAGGEAEHAGEEAEHAGEEAVKVTAEDIKAAMTAHIEAATKDGGVLRIHDEVAGADLKLEFVKIHDPVRQIEGKGYFACTDFHPEGAEEGKLYDLDFWLDVKDGALVVTETKIHKHPKQEGDGWVKEARYTFVDDEPVEVE